MTVYPFYTHPLSPRAESCSSKYRAKPGCLVLGLGGMDHESIWLSCPDFAYGFLSRQALEGRQLPVEVVGSDEVAEVPVDLLGVS